MSWECGSHSGHWLLATVLWAGCGADRRTTTANDLRLFLNVTNDDNGIEELHRTTVTLHRRHAEFLESENVNFSALTRDLLDKYMDFQRRTEDFEITE